MEERHDEHGSVRRSQLVGVFDVVCHSVSVCVGSNSYYLQVIHKDLPMVLVRLRCDKGTLLLFNKNVLAD